MPTFTPSPEEVKAGEFSPETLFMAIHSFNRDGFLVMEGIEDPQLLTNMRQAMLPEREEISKLSHKAEEAKKTGTSTLVRRHWDVAHGKQRIISMDHPLTSPNWGFTNCTKTRSSSRC